MISNSYEVKLCFLSHFAKGMDIKPTVGSVGMNVQISEQKKLFPVLKFDAVFHIDAFTGNMVCSDYDFPFAGHYRLRKIASGRTEFTDIDTFMCASRPAEKTAFGVLKTDINGVGGVNIAHKSLCSPVIIVRYRYFDNIFSQKSC